jgi:hypothetical protein
MMIGGLRAARQRPFATQGNIARKRTGASLRPSYVDANGAARRVLPGADAGHRAIQSGNETNPLAG